MSDELSVRTTSFEQSLNHQEHDDAGASSTGAAAPDGATRTEPPVTRAPSQRSQAVKALVDQFALAAHIAAPKLADGAKAYSQRTVFEWFVPLGEIYDRCGKDEPWALAVVQDAVAALDSKGLTISTPRSILKTAVHLVRGGRNGSAPGGVPDDGRTLVPIDVAVRRFKERLRHGDDSGNHEPV